MTLFTATGAIASAYSKIFPCKIISSRILSDFEIAAAIKDVDVVIHNAASIKSETFLDSIEANYTLTARILNIIYDVNPDIHFCYLSSMSILSSCDTYKSIEEMDSYSFSKYFAEIYCLKHPLSNLTCVRFSTIFYKNHLRDGLSLLVFTAVKENMMTIYNHGIALRDFIPIESAVINLNYLIKNFKTGKGVFNIASGNAMSFSSICSIISRIISDVKIKDTNINSSKKVLSDFTSNCYLPEPFNLEREINNYIELLKT